MPRPVAPLLSGVVPLVDIVTGVDRVWRGAVGFTFALGRVARCCARGPPWLLPATVRTTVSRLLSCIVDGQNDISGNKASWWRSNRSRPGRCEGSRPSTNGLEPGHSAGQWCASRRGLVLWSVLTFFAVWGWASHQAELRSEMKAQGRRVFGKRGSAARANEHPRGVDVRDVWMLAAVERDRLGLGGVFVSVIGSRVRGLSDVSAQKTLRARCPSTSQESWSFWRPYHSISTPLHSPTP